MNYQELQTIPGYRIAYRHNPRHFYKSGFWLEILPDGRYKIHGRPRRGQKQFRVLGVLKPA